MTHWADLPPSEIEVVSGIAVTSPLRTLIDLARTFQLPEAVVAADAVLRMGLAQPADLAGLLRYVGRGAHLVRRMAALADGRAESPHESRVRVLLVLGGLPPEELQLVVADPAAPGGERPIHSGEIVHVRVTAPAAAIDSIMNEKGIALPGPYLRSAILPLRNGKGETRFGAAGSIR